MRFHFEHTVPVAREILFRFFENPAGLERLHGGWSQVRVLAHEPQVRVGGETWVEITLARCLPMVLGFRHTIFESPFHFGEQAIHGPFSKFVHLHEFEPLADGTLMRDSLEVSLPWHYGGELAVKYMLARHIVKMFQQRAQALDRLVGDGLITRLTAPIEICTRI